jgi:hypothetical protein
MRYLLQRSSFSEQIPSENADHTQLLMITDQSIQRHLLFQPVLGVEFPYISGFIPILEFNSKPVQNKWLQIGHNVNLWSPSEVNLKLFQRGGQGHLYPDKTQNSGV